MLRLNLPPLDQQTTLMDYLDSETARIDTIISKTQTSIEKLKEYQTALISAAVTVKIDVRGEG
jgi:type I restriction enzyme, S subunit